MLFKNIIKISTNGQVESYDYTINCLLYAAFALITAILIMIYLRKNGIAALKYKTIKGVGDHMITFGQFLIAFVIFYALCILIIDLLYLLFPTATISDQNAVFNRVANFKTQWFPYIYVGIIVPIVEELYFRKMTMSIVARSIKNPYVVILIESLLFMIIHCYSVPGLITVLLYGIFFGCLYYYTGSLWYSVLAHSVVNILSLSEINATIIVLILMNLLLGAIISLIGKAMKQIQNNSADVVKGN